MLVYILAKTMPIINAKVLAIVALLMNRHQSTPRIIHVAIPDQSRSELSACGQFDDERGRAVSAKKDSFFSDVLTNSQRDRQTFVSQSRKIFLARHDESEVTSHRDLKDLDTRHATANLTTIVRYCQKRQLMHEMHYLDMQIDDQ